MNGYGGVPVTVVYQSNSVIWGDKNLPHTHRKDF